MREPWIGDSLLDLTLICQVAEFVDQYLAQHELRKRIFRRFRAEEIEIPFPQRVMHIRDAEGRRPTPVASDASPVGSGKDAIPSQHI